MNAMKFRDDVTTNFDGELSASRAGEILIVSNDASHRESMSRYFANRSYPFTMAQTTQEAVARLCAGGIDLVVAAMGDSESHGLELTRAVRDVMPGLPMIVVSLGGAELNGIHLDYASWLSRELPDPDRKALRRLSSLTARERQVMDLMVAGHGNKMIARKLAISPRTVEHHRAQVMSKMNVTNVAKLVHLVLGAQELAPHMQRKTETLNDFSGDNVVPLVR